MPVTEQELEAAILALEVLPPPAGPRGPQGPQGDRGPEGPRGVEGPEGPAGPDGRQGDRGPEGPRGPRGFDGDQGELGPRGPMGIEGPVGPRGPQGWLGSTGPAGEKGEKGEKGDKGEKGERGPAGTNHYGGGFGGGGIAAGGDKIAVQEDGTLVGSATALNFEGATVSIAGQVARIVIAAAGPGGSDAYYRHDQGIAADVWSVHHGLGKHPSVTVVDSADTVLVGEVVYLDEDNVELHFSAPFSGRAYLN